MITKFKIFEENTNIVYMTEILVNSHEGFTKDQVIKICAYIVKILNDNNIKHKTYFAPDPDRPGFYFIFDYDVSEEIDELKDMRMEETSLEEFVDNFEDYRISDDDIVMMFDINKYNL